MRSTGGGAPAEKHAAINLAIYGEDKTKSRWIFSEYRTGLDRSEDGLSLGKNSIEWRGDELILRIEEQAPWSQRGLSGEIRLRAPTRYAPAIDLAGNGEHRWYPVAPACSAQVRLSRPSLNFDGVAYHDVNHGSRALEEDFVEWDWSRLGSAASVDSNEGVITYDVVTRGGPDAAHKRRMFGFGASGLTMLDTSGTELRNGGRGFWGVARKPVGDSGTRPRHLRTLEDSPFYTRSLIETTVGAKQYRGVHESLRMDRFVSPVVQCMLPFRIRSR
jgi:carotenoid 1,2-hydratase